MTNNLRHWSALEKTDPKHTKRFQRAGGFSGTAIKPIYTIQKMTEHFGPCGIGWGIEAPHFEIVEATPTKLVFCTVAIWYLENQTKSAPVYGVGGDNVIAFSKDGKPRGDDEAFKKAFTDAIGNALKQIGVSADVHMGLFDDSKYVSALNDEFAEGGKGTDAVTTDKPAPAPASQQKKVTKGVPSAAPAKHPPGSCVIETGGKPEAWRDQVAQKVAEAEDGQHLQRILMDNSEALDKFKVTFPALWKPLSDQIDLTMDGFTPKDAPK